MTKLKTMRRMPGFRRRRKLYLELVKMAQERNGTSFVRWVTSLKNYSHQSALDMLRTGRMVIPRRVTRDVPSVLKSMMKHV